MHLTKDCLRNLRISHVVSIGQGAGSWCSSRRCAVKEDISSICHNRVWGSCNLQAHCKIMITCLQSTMLQHQEVTAQNSRQSTKNESGPHLHAVRSFSNDRSDMVGQNASQQGAEQQAQASLCRRLHRPDLSSHVRQLMSATAAEGGLLVIVRAASSGIAIQIMARLTNASCV